MDAEIKVKDEIVDTEFDQIENPEIAEAEPADIPENFFDDLEDNKFLDELIDNYGIGEKKESDKPNDVVREGEEGEGEDKVMYQCLEEIQKLTKIIEKRKKKLLVIESNVRSTRAFSRSRSRSPLRRRRSRSRERRRSRDRRRSISRERRLRRSSPEAGRHARERRSRSNSKTYRRRSRGRDVPHTSKDKKVPFIEELAQIFAAKGQPFPEKEKLQAIAMQHREALLKEVSEPNENYQTGPVHPQFMNQMQQSPGGNFLPNFSHQGNFPMLPVNVKPEPMDLEYPQVEYPPNRSVDVVDPMMRKIKVEKEVELPGERKEKVLKMCTEAVQKCQSADANPISTRFFYTPTIVARSGINETIDNRSPLNRITNVQFKFNSTNTTIELDKWGIMKLPDSCSNVARIIGFEAGQLIDKLQCRELPSIFKKEKKENLMKNGKSYTPFLTDTGTQCDEVSCTDCIRQKLRKFIDKPVQAYPEIVEVSTQTDGGYDELPIIKTMALMNSSQILALSDFAELLREPTVSVSDLYKVRQRLMEIYEMSQRPPLMPARIQPHNNPGYNSNMTPYFCGPNMPMNPVPQPVPSPYVQHNQQNPMAHPMQHQMNPQPGPVMMHAPHLDGPKKMPQSYPDYHHMQPAPGSSHMPSRRDIPSSSRSIDPFPEKAQQSGAGSSGGTKYGRGAKNISSSRNDPRNRYNTNY